MKLKTPGGGRSAPPYMDFKLTVPAFRVSNQNQTQLIISSTKRISIGPLVPPPNSSFPAFEINPNIFRPP